MPRRPARRARRSARGSRRGAPRGTRTGRSRAELRHELAHEGVGRRARQLLARPDLVEPAALEDGDAVGEAERLARDRASRGGPPLPTAPSTPGTRAACARRAIGSSAPKGSSMRTSGGRAARARATPTRCRCPPERPEGRRSANCAGGRPTISSSSSERARRSASRPSEQPRHGLDVLAHRPVRKEAALLDDVADAPAQRDGLLLRRGVRPKTRTVPASASSSRLTSFRAVVLPQPDGPTSATVSPGPTASENPSRTARPEANALRMSEYSRIGAVTREPEPFSITRPGAPGYNSAHGVILRCGRHRRRSGRLDRRHDARARWADACVVLEREKFPRFHVGESLLPFSLPILDRLGVHDKIRAAGFMKKYGAFFWNEDNGTTRPVVFAEARDPHAPDGVPGQARRVRRPPPAALGVLRRRGARGDDGRGRALRGRPRRRRPRARPRRGGAPRRSARRSSSTRRGRAPSSPASSACAASTRS